MNFLIFFVLLHNVKTFMPKQSCFILTKSHIFNSEDISWGGKRALQLGNKKTNKLTSRASRISRSDPKDPRAKNC